MEHAGTHHAPSTPRALGAPNGLSHLSGDPELTGTAGARPWPPAPPTAQVGREGTLKSILNKSMQSQAPGRAAPSPPARSKIIAELLLLLPGGRRPWGWKRNQQSVCTFWGCLVQYKWNRVGCSHTASTSPISGRRRWDQVDLGTYW